MSGPREDWGGRTLMAVRCMQYYDPARGASVATFLNRGWLFAQIDATRRETGWSTTAKKKTRARLVFMGEVFDARSVEDEPRERVGDVSLSEEMRLWARGVPERTIAAIVGIPHGTVKSRLARDRKLLAELYTGEKRPTKRSR
ncbi:MAG: hypothetical protein IT433_12905 [Phycisphaerales bacterium]|nr:hypothetical protein [Phycisphaerales bacterium]